MPTTPEMFQALAAGLAELVEVNEAVRHGNLARLSDFPASALEGLVLEIRAEPNIMRHLETEPDVDPVADAMTPDQKAIQGYVRAQLNAATDNCIAGFNAAEDAEIKATGFFEATVEHGQTAGINYPNAQKDLSEAQKRLTLFVLQGDDYQDEALEDTAATTAAQRAKVDTAKADALAGITGGTFLQHSQRRVLIEKTTEKALWAGLTYLHAARVQMAVEILRLEARADQRQRLADDEVHQSVMGSVKRNLEWGGKLLLNAESASPEFSRLTAPAPEDDNNGGAPRPKLN